MPSKSPEQRRFMQAAAHSYGFYSAYGKISRSSLAEGFGG